MIWIPLGSTSISLRPARTHDEQTKFVLEGGSSAIVAFLDRLKGQDQQGILVLFQLIIKHIRSHIIQYV